MSDGQAPPQRIGGFELLQKIGEGGMGSVWKARQLSLDRIVALKVLNPEYSKSQEFLARFRNEARAAAGFHDAHVIQVYDAGNADGVDYLAMEYVAGQSVRATLNVRGKIAEDTALDIIIPVAQALSQAWDRARLIHRDVKPENILIDQDGTVKLGDLGLAKSAATPESLRLTRPGQSLGTPYYVAPEQAQGMRDLDFRCDIYSLGATLYHMVTGHALFEDLPTIVALLKHLDAHVPDARRYQPQLSENLCLVMEKMLAKARDDRYANWQELISDLQLVRSSRRPLNARIAPGRSTMQRFESVGPDGLPIEAHRAPAAPPAAAPPRERVMTPVAWAGLAVIGACLLGMAVLWKISADRELELTTEQTARQLEAQAAVAARAYYEAMEFARSHRRDYAEIIRRFDAIARNYPKTEFAPAAAEQAGQWRQKLTTVQEDAARRLTAEKQARTKMAGAKETEARRLAAAKEQQARNAAKAEEDRRLLEQAARAREAAQAAYNEFVPGWLTWMARRDYADAIHAAQQAAADKRFEPLKPLLATHAQAAQRLQGFVARLGAPDSPLIGKAVALSNISGTVTGVSKKGGVVIEKIAGVGIVVPLLTAAPDDLLRLAAATVATTDPEAQINYALLLMAEGYAEPARQGLTANPTPAADPFEDMANAVVAALNESEAPTVLADLRAQVAANQWPTAFARMIALDTRFVRTAAVKAAAAELNTIRDQLLALIPEPAFAAPSARLAVITARQALEASDWQRTLDIVNQLDSRIAAGAFSAAVVSSVQAEFETVRQQLAGQSGLPAADVIRRRDVERAGGRVWQVLDDGTGDAKTFAEALAAAKDHDGIELGPGRHDISLVDGAARRALYIYGRGGSLPLLTDAGAGDAAAQPGGFLLRCGDGWRLENLHFQFSVNALAQAGPALRVENCAFSRPAAAPGQALVLTAACDGAWQTVFEHCLLMAAAADAICSLPQSDGATRHKVEFDHCTLWLPDGALHTTSRPELRRQVSLTLQNCAVLARRVAAATWTRALFTSGFSYTGNNNLFFLARPGDDTPSPGDATWSSMFPGQDAASSTNELTAAVPASLKSNRPAPALAAFADPAVGDLRLNTAGPWASLADDQGVAGVRWPDWRWTAFLKPALPGQSSKTE
ncbi:MAG: serine/threonine protein kinase [Verrucomicrobia bacterium]|nr:serine/threonine protein kinase [Verrucomicrobiota bacterium]